MIQKLGYYLSRPGYYLSIAYYDIPFRVIFIILISKLLLFDYFIGLGTLSFSPDFGIILIMLTFALLIANRFIKLTYLLSINIIFSFIFLLNSLYRSYFSDFASVYCINQIPMLTKVADSVIYLMKKEYLFIVDFIFLPFLLLPLKQKIKYNFNIVDRIKTFCILFLLGLYCNFAIFAYIKTGMIHNFFNFQGERSILVANTGIINYHVIDALSYMSAEIKKKHITQSDFYMVTNWFTENNNKRTIVNAFTGKEKGCNVIIIQAESLQNFVIGRNYKGREITPQLNRLARKAIYFNNIYDQTAAGGSSDATFLANCSLFPAIRGAVSFLYPHNNFDSLPKVLREHGYISTVMEPYAKSFWNSETFDKTLGFETQYYQDNFVINDVIGLGLSDRAFLSQSIDKIRELPKPFYAFLRTLTAHYPYNYVTNDINNFPVGDLEGKTIGNYIRTMHYVDSAIGEFLNKLSENNLASNSIIVVYGDHRARLSNSELRLIGVTDMNENRKIPVIIYLPNRNQAYKRTSIGGLIDVSPTICNILGIDVSDKFFMGRDLGQKENSFAIFRDGSYICDNGSINETSAQQQLMISDLLIEKDMIPRIRDSGTHLSSP